ncbi:hypothetical protein FRC18_006839 [Serendipita sp. 400]|nr:hypothetical protein FRC18_006839 [Serendipita sp. 400]
MSSKSGGRGKQGAKPTANPSTATKRRQRTLRSSGRPGSTGSEEDTPTDAKRRRKQSQIDDETYGESGSDKEYRFTAFMKLLDNANKSIPNLLPHISFALYFEALQEGKYELLARKQANMAEIFAATRDEIKQLPDKKQQTIANELVQDLQERWEATLQEIHKPLAPSAFAKSAGWALSQVGPARIDCLRPSDRSGLPISLLHPAFATFMFLVDQPMPFEFNEGVVKAMEVASKLCMIMPDHFEDQTARKKALFATVQPLFPNRSFLTASFGSATPDGALINPDGSVDIVIEVKNEPGASGDVQMQATRSFDAAAIENLADKHGFECSSFVLAVDGPNLLVCGGFKDQGPSVIEPLSHWCSMLPDRLGVRQEVLAKHLYALQASLPHLQGPVPGNVVQCPRIYRGFQTNDGQTQPLKFISPYNPIGSHCRLLFKAKTVKSDVEVEVLAKVVRGAYGKEAHCLAAKNGFAPELYGVATADGAPSAYIMEFLSENQGWVPLQRVFFKSSLQWDKLEAGINKFLTFLQKHGLVHGDLRPNNILVQLQSEEVRFCVLDWDWAGTYTSARYPLDRNPEANLPGRPGDLIRFDDDIATITDCFKKAKSLSYF